MGVKISDSGNLKEDVNRYVDGKRSNLSIKFRNFCRRNFLAPLFVKMKVLNSCVGASLVYGCETWGMNKVKNAETAYREGLKSALSIRDCTNNEIVYIESDELPLEVRISKQQLKFWTGIQDIVNADPDHYISKLVAIGEGTNYIKYYRNLANTYTDAKSCTNRMKTYHKETWKEKIEIAARADPDSKLGTYLMVNPELKAPVFDKKFEFQRTLITRYRTGSHNLRIEKDRRLPYSNREDRLCSCNLGIQTIKHVITECPLLQSARVNYEIDSLEKGISNDDYLMEMECILGI